MMTLEEKFQAVPRRIRDWFWSDEMDQMILEIEQKFALPEGEIVLPTLLFSVEIRDLPLESLEEGLRRGLSLTPRVARALYEEVKVRVFLPIARDFLSFGIGTTELAGTIQAQEPLAMPTPPTLVTTPMPPVPTAPLTPAPAIPVPEPASAMQPIPVSLYRDTVASQAAVATPRLGVRDTGDISGTVASAPMAQRAARIDLGVPAISTTQDDEFKSLFVQRETPLPQKIDYGAPPPSLSGLPQMPVPLGAAPAPMLDSSAPFISPRVEVVSIPSAPQEEVLPTGFFAAIMHRVAPWHAKKFGAQVQVPEPLLPAATINYSDVPPAPPAPDAPAPPKAQA